MTGNRWGAFGNDISPAMAANGGSSGDKFSAMRTCTSEKSLESLRLASGARRNDNKNDENTDQQDDFDTHIDLIVI